MATASSTLPSGQRHFWSPVTSEDCQDFAFCGDGLRHILYSLGTGSGITTTTCYDYQGRPTNIRTMIRLNRDPPNYMAGERLEGILFYFTDNFLPLRGIRIHLFSRLKMDPPSWKCPVIGEMPQQQQQKQYQQQPRKQFVWDKIYQSFHLRPEFDLGFTTMGVNSVRFHFNIPATALSSSDEFALHVVYGISVQILLVEPKNSLWILGPFLRVHSAPLTGPPYTDLPVTTAGTLDLVGKKKRLKGRLQIKATFPYTIVPLYTTYTVRLRMSGIHGDCNLKALVYPVLVQVLTLDDQIYRRAHLSLQNQAVSVILRRRKETTASFQLHLGNAVCSTPSRDVTACKQLRVSYEIWVLAHYDSMKIPNLVVSQEISVVTNFSPANEPTTELPYGPIYIVPIENEMLMTPTRICSLIPEDEKKKVIRKAARAKSTSGNSTHAPESGNETSSPVQTPESKITFGTVGDMTATERQTRTAAQVSEAEGDSNKPAQVPEAESDSLKDDHVGYTSDVHVCLCVYAAKQIFVEIASMDLCPKHTHKKQGKYTKGKQPKDNQNVASETSSEEGEQLPEIELQFELSKKIKAVRQQEVRTREERSRFRAFLGAALDWLSYHIFGHQCPGWYNDPILPDLLTIKVKGFIVIKQIAPPLGDIPEGDADQDTRDNQEDNPEQIKDVEPHPGSLARIYLNQTQPRKSLDAVLSHLMCSICGARSDGEEYTPLLGDQDATNSWPRKASLHENSSMETKKNPATSEASSLSREILPTMVVVNSKYEECHENSRLGLKNTHPSFRVTEDYPNLLKDETYTTTFTTSKLVVIEERTVYIAERTLTFYAVFPSNERDQENIAASVETNPNTELVSNDPCPKHEPPMSQDWNADLETDVSSSDESNSHTLVPECPSSPVELDDHDDNDDGGDNNPARAMIIQTHGDEEGKNSNAETASNTQIFVPYSASEEIQNLPSAVHGTSGEKATSTDRESVGFHQTNTSEVGCQRPSQLSSSSDENSTMNVPGSPEMNARDENADIPSTQHCICLEALSPATTCDGSTWSCTGFITHQSSACCDGGVPDDNWFVPCVRLIPNEFDIPPALRITENSEDIGTSIIDPNSIGQVDSGNAEGYSTGYFLLAPVEEGSCGGEGESSINQGSCEEESESSVNQGRCGEEGESSGNQGSYKEESESSINRGNNDTEGEFCINQGNCEEKGESSFNQGSCKEEGEFSVDQGSCKEEGESSVNQGSCKEEGESSVDQGSCKEEGESSVNQGGCKEEGKSCKEEGKSNFNQGSCKEEGESSVDQGCCKEEGESSVDQGSCKEEGGSSVNQASCKEEGESSVDQGSCKEEGGSSVNQGSCKEEGESSVNQGGCKEEGKSCKEEGNSNFNQGSCKEEGESSINQGSCKEEGESSINRGSCKEEGESSINQRSCKEEDDARDKSSVENERPEFVNQGEESEAASQDCLDTSFSSNSSILISETDSVDQESESKQMKRKQKIADRLLSWAAKSREARETGSKNIPQRMSTARQMITSSIEDRDQVITKDTSAKGSKLCTDAEKADPVSIRTRKGLRSAGEYSEVTENEIGEQERAKAQRREHAFLPNYGQDTSHSTEGNSKVNINTATLKPLDPSEINMQGTKPPSATIKTLAESKISYGNSSRDSGNRSTQKEVKVSTRKSGSAVSDRRASQSAEASPDAAETVVGKSKHLPESLVEEDERSGREQISSKTADIPTKTAKTVQASSNPAVTGSTSDDIEKSKQITGSKRNRKKKKGGKSEHSLCHEPKDSNSSTGDHSIKSSQLEMENINTDEADSEAGHSQSDVLVKAAGGAKTNLGISSVDNSSTSVSLRSQQETNTESEADSKVTEQESPPGADMVDAVFNFEAKSTTDTEQTSHETSKDNTICGSGNNSQKSHRKGQSSKAKKKKRKKSSVNPKPLSDVQNDTQGCSTLDSKSFGVEDAQAGTSDSIFTPAGSPERAADLCTMVCDKNNRCQPNISVSSPTTSACEVVTDNPRNKEDIAKPASHNEIAKEDDESEGDPNNVRGNENSVTPTIHSDTGKENDIVKGATHLTTDEETTKQENKSHVKRKPLSERYDNIPSTSCDERKSNTEDFTSMKTHAGTSEPRTGIRIFEPGDKTTEQKSLRDVSSTSVAESMNLPGKLEAVSNTDEKKQDTSVTNRFKPEWKFSETNSSCSKGAEDPEHVTVCFDKEIKQSAENCESLAKSLSISKPKAFTSEDTMATSTNDNAEASVNSQHKSTEELSSFAITNERRDTSDESAISECRTSSASRQGECQTSSVTTEDRSSESLEVELRYKQRVLFEGATCGGKIEAGNEPQQPLTMEIRTHPKWVMSGETEQDMEEVSVFQRRLFGSVCESVGAELKQQQQQENPLRAQTDGSKASRKSKSKIVGSGRKVSFSPFSSNDDSKTTFSFQVGPGTFSMSTKQGYPDDDVHVDLPEWKYHPTSYCIPQDSFRHLLPATSTGKTKRKKHPSPDGVPNFEQNVRSALPKNGYRPAVSKQMDNSSKNSGQSFRGQQNVGSYSTQVIRPFGVKFPDSVKFSDKHRPLWNKNICCEIWLQHTGIWCHKVHMWSPGYDVYGDTKEILRRPRNFVASPHKLNPDAPPFRMSNRSDTHNPPKAVEYVGPDPAIVGQHLSAMIDRYNSLTDSLNRDPYNWHKLVLLDKVGRNILTLQEMLNGNTEHPLQTTSNDETDENIAQGPPEDETGNFLQNKELQHIWTAQVHGNPNDNTNQFPQQGAQFSVESTDYNMNYQYHRANLPSYNPAQENTNQPSQPVGNVNDPTRLTQQPQEAGTTTSDSNVHQQVPTTVQGTDVRSHPAQPLMEIQVRQAAAAAAAAAVAAATPRAHGRTNRRSSHDQQRHRDQLAQSVHAHQQIHHPRQADSRNMYHVTQGRGQGQTQRSPMEVPPQNRHPYGAPRQPYGTPRQPYGTPRQPYGTPRQPYGTPRHSYGTIPQPYGAPQPHRGAHLSRLQPVQLPDGAVAFSQPGYAHRCQ